jgi:chromosome segregation ATPase
MTVRSIGTIAAVVVVGWLATAQAQTPGASNSGDIMPALLAEVRALRVAMEQMTSAGSRVQLALGRLQLQEQRLTAANGRLAEGRNQLASAQRHAAQLQERVTGLEGILASDDLPKSDAKTSPEEMRKTLTYELQQAQREMHAANGEVQRLLNQENILANDVSTEQARWSDLNQRLEDLERALRPVK